MARPGETDDHAEMMKILSGPAQRITESVDLAPEMEPDFDPEPVESEVTTIFGTVLLYDKKEGCGEVELVDGARASVLRSVIHERGFFTLAAGTQLECEVEKDEDGTYTVVSILSALFSEAVLLTQTKSHEAVGPLTGPVTATVQHFKDAQSYGFVSIPDEEENAFIHLASFGDNPPDKLLLGQEVIVRYGQGQKGLVASEAKLPN